MHRFIHSPPEAERPETIDLKPARDPLEKGARPEVDFFMEHACGSEGSRKVPEKSWELSRDSRI